MASHDLTVPTFDFRVSDDRFEADILKLVSMARPDWSSNSLLLRRFKFGVLNRVVGVYQDQDPNDLTLVRVFGATSDFFTDRDNEIRMMKILAVSGLSPPIYARFANGICYGFVEGETLDPVSVRREETMKSICRHFAEMHAIDWRRFLDHKQQQQVEPHLFRYLTRLLELLPDNLVDPIQNQRYQKFVPSKSVLINEFEKLKSAIIKLQPRLGICHNDLNLTNVIYDPVKKKATFIDLEFAGVNFTTFDIVNHLCETSAMHYYNSGLVPGEEETRKWLSYYLKELNQLTNSNQPIDKAIDDLWPQVKLFFMASHMAWGCWSLVQARHSDVDYDFIAYGVQRLHDYFVVRQ